MYEGAVFEYKEKKYRIIFSDKPWCMSGEPKTDIYVKAENIDNASEIIEIKISYKKENADFIENKMTADRAKQILGDDWKSIISDLLDKRGAEFESVDLVFFSKKGNTDSGAITLGWKFEIVDKPKAGRLSGNLNLNKEQLIEAYKGARNTDDKRNAKVCGQIIDNSGVADYMVRIDSDKLLTAQDVINNLVPIEEYVKTHPVSTYVCKALNYRTKSSNKRKWDGDRPLSVYVDWSNDNGMLTPKIIKEKPLEKRGNEMANRLKKYLEELAIKDTDDLSSENLNTDKFYKKNN